jgi:hypothetical protein
MGDSGSAKRQLSIAVIAATLLCGAALLIGLPLSWHVYLTHSLNSGMGSLQKGSNRAGAMTFSVNSITDAVSVTIESPPTLDDNLFAGLGTALAGGMAQMMGPAFEANSSRYLVLLHLPHGRTAEDVRAALTRQGSKLPSELRRTLTWGQGKEMADHVRFTTDTHMEVYFCDPYSPWQRGSNENTNGLLRQYFPRKADLSLHSAAQLNAVATELNNRPRQTLNWMKPSEVFSAGLLRRSVEDNLGLRVG